MALGKVVLAMGAVIVGTIVIHNAQTPAAPAPQVQQHPADHGYFGICSNALFRRIPTTLLTQRCSQRPKTSIVLNYECFHFAYTIASDAVNSKLIPNAFADVQRVVHSAEQECER